MSNSYHKKGLLFVLVCTLSVLSCQKDDSGAGFMSSLLTVTPKQALIECSVELPAETSAGKCEFGVMYSTKKNFTAEESDKVKAEHGDAASFEVVLRHLECGTEYYYRPYAKTGGDYILGGLSSFKTEPLPQNAVDLHLSNDALWSDRNVGAFSISDRGDTFCWGETVRKEYTPENVRDYKFGVFIDEYAYPVYFSKYTYDDGKYIEWWYDYSRNFIGDGREFLDPEDDAATVNMGGRWRTPSAQDYEILVAETEHIWSKVDKASYVRFAKGDNSIEFQSGTRHWTSDLSGYGVDKLNYHVESLYSSTSALEFMISGSSDDGVDYVVVKQKPYSFYPRIRYVTNPVRPIYDCSVEERKKSEPRPGYTAPVIEPSSGLAPEEMARYSLADGSWSISLGNCFVTVPSSGDEISELHISSSGKMVNDYIVLHLMCGNIDGVAVGEDLDLIRLGVTSGFPSSSNPENYIRTLSGRITLVERQERRVILNCDNVRFSVAYGDYVLDGKVSCRLVSSM